MLPNYLTTVFIITHALEVIHIFVLVQWKNYTMLFYYASLPISESSDRHLQLQMTNDGIIYTRSWAFPYCLPFRAENLLLHTYQHPSGSRSKKISSRFLVSEIRWVEFPLTKFSKMQREGFWGGNQWCGSEHFIFDMKIMHVIQVWGSGKKFQVKINIWESSAFVWQNQEARWGQGSELGRGTQSRDCVSPGGPIVISRFK